MSIRFNINENAGKVVAYYDSISVKKILDKY